LPIAAVQIVECGHYNSRTLKVGRRLDYNVIRPTINFWQLFKATL